MAFNDPSQITKTSAVGAAVREGDVTATLVRLADSLVEGFDVVEVLNDLAHDCVRLLGVTAAGILLADPAGALHVVAASSEETRLLELVQLQRDEGPCLDCYRGGEPVYVADLAHQAGRWPVFSDAARETGYRSVHALPLRLRQDIVGALNLFGADAGQLTPPAVRLGQALADMATITILHERALREHEHVVAQLRIALVSRVVLEQAKGVLAERGGLAMDDAFQALRKHARDRNLRLRDVSSGIVRGTIDANEVLHPVARPAKRRPGSRLAPP